MRYKQGTGIQVISRAAAILRVCQDADGGLSLGDIAERVDLPRSTVQRIVAALAAEGLLVAGGDARSVRLGPQIHALADGQRVDVVEIAHAHLKALAEATGETVDLALLRRDHMVFVDQITGSQRLRAVSAVGEPFPMHCTANGKAALALLDATVAEPHYRAALKRYTPSTILTAPALRREIARVAAAGIASDREEHTLGICALGAAFRVATGAIYAVSIPMPALRFAERQASFAAALKDTVAAIRRTTGS